MSPNAARRELDSASLHKVNVTSPPEMIWSAICDEETSECNRRTFRGEGRERTSKEWSRYLGDPLQPGIPTEVDTGNNNHRDCCKRESERPIVAEKSGKPDGAKGPYLIRVESEERRAA